MQFGVLGNRVWVQESDLNVGDMWFLGEEAMNLRESAC